MSGAPKNIQRDCAFVQLDRTNDLTWGTNYLANATAGTVNSSGIVNLDYGCAYTADQVTMNAVDVSSIGVLISGPTKDRVPYRVQANILVPVDGDAIGLLTMGWAPSSPTGSNDIISEVKHAAFYISADATFIVEPPPVAYQGAPLAVCLSIVATKTLTAAVVQGGISVQNLGVKPPTMQNAIS